ncbi:MAG: glycerate kinase [Actinomycetota bacterium]|nr:glycerate kinase [Actinomycetota bacterium]
MVAVRIVLAPTRFAGTLTALEAAEAMARGWALTAPHDDLVLVPLSDGGTGFVDVVARGVAAQAGERSRCEVLAATVSDPLGRPVPAGVLVVESSATRTAYVEASQACGPDLVAPDERDPAHTTSAGLGQLLDLALSTTPTRVVVGLGATTTHDAGAGMLAALGAGADTVLGRGGLRLGDVQVGDLERLDQVVGRFRGVELVLATSATVTLLGLQGASAVEAEPRGATPEQAQALESAFGHWVDLLRRVRPERTDLLTGTTRRLDREPGAGAGGGIGHALFLLGGHRVDGAQLVADVVGLGGQIARADLVLTGEGTFDWRSLRDSAPAVVADLALAAGIPAVILAGQVRVGRRESMTAGLSGTYAVCDRPQDLPAVLANAAGTLEARAARVATTWSPAR